MKKLIRINIVATLLLFGLIFGANQLFAYNGGSGEPMGECPEVNPPDHDVLLPDSKNCAIFYKCDWGETILIPCPDDLLFSVGANKCDYASFVNCDRGFGVVN